MPTAVTDWAWTVAGGLYLGWMGAHFVLLRNVGLRRGQTWLDSGAWRGIVVDGSGAVFDLAGGYGAYLVGRAWGRHKMSPRVSPPRPGKVLWAALSSAHWAAQVLAMLLRLVAARWGK